MTCPNFSLSMEMGILDPPEAISDNERGGFTLKMLFQNHCHGTHKHIIQTSLSATVSSGFPVPPQSSPNVCTGALQLCMCA